MSPSHASDESLTNTMPAIAVTLLAALAVTGYFGLHFLGRNNGFFPLMEATSKSGQYPLDLTSNKSLAETAAFFVAFFYPAVDGNSPDLSLACYVFAGQFVAGLTALIIEGYRAGNAGRMICFTTAFGMLYQVIGGGIMIPLYLLLHLLTAPTATRPTRESLTLPSSVLVAALPAVLFGMVLPTIVMALPTPATLSYNLKLNSIVAWQLFPLYTGLLVYPLRYIVPVPTQTTYTTLLRYVYGLSIVIAAIAHISAVTLAASATLFPGLFNPGVSPQLSSALFAFPPHPLSTVKASSIAQGAFWFIQYDYILCSWAFMVWSFDQRSVAWSETTLIGWTTRIGLFLSKCILLGPMAGSVLLIWERDEAVIGGASEEQIRKGS